MWLYLILTLVIIKLYNKISCGWCYSRTIMTGTVTIVTGAHSGIGFETAFNLARRGAKVILACRNKERGIRAAEDIISRTGNKNVYYKHLDLASLASVRNFAEDFKRSEYKLDVLVNNAGCLGYGLEKTEDGIIREMQVNHFGPFLLTVLLIPALKKSDSGRIVNVASLMHNYGVVDLEDMDKVKTWKLPYNSLTLNSNGKLCNVLFSNELARRLEGTRITVNSLHPGHVRTSIFRNNDNVTEKFMNFVIGNLFKSSLEGAQTCIYLAVSDDVAEVTGRFFVDCKESSMSSKAKDESLAAKLWSYSEDMVKLKPGEKI